MEPLNRQLFRSSMVVVAAFRVRPDDPRFSDTGPTRQPLLVFPRKSVRITHDGRAPVVADATTVMFYNRHQHYRRDPISADGDWCEWFGVPEGAVVDAIAEYDPSVRDRPGQPYAFVGGSCPPEVYLAQRRLTEALRTPDGLDTFHVEELVLTLLARVIEGVYDGRVKPGGPSGKRSRQARIDLAEAARALIGQRFDQPLTLPTLAAELHTSPFHLSRVFRSHTGLTLHRYITELRVRASLDRLSDPNADLTDLALDLGFASHSHFTERFRKTFGEPPSTVRSRLRRRPSNRARIRQRAIASA